MVRPSKFFICFLLFFCMSLNYSFGQEEGAEEIKELEEEEEGKFGFGLVLGYTHIPEARTEEGVSESENLPTIGFDLYYYPAERWKLGLVIDLELNQYEVDFKGDRLHERMPW